MTKEIKFILIIISALLVFTISIRIVEYFIAKTVIESAFEQMDKSFANTSKTLKETTIALTPVVKIAKPTSSRNNKQIVYISDSKQKKVINVLDKRCNQLITQSWTDKSEETKQAKKEACAHNKIN